MTPDPEPHGAVEKNLLMIHRRKKCQDSRASVKDVTNRQSKVPWAVVKLGEFGETPANGEAIPSEVLEGFGSSERVEARSLSPNDNAIHERPALLHVDDEMVRHSEEIRRAGLNGQRNVCLGHPNPNHWRSNTGNRQLNASLRKRERKFLRPCVVMRECNWVN